MILQHILTEDGSSTFFIPELNEHYHSIHGAVQESRHIFIREGFDKTPDFPARIFEAGFGTGLNAFLTCLSADKEKKTVHYTAVEKYPVEENLLALLNYPEKTDPSKGEVFKMIHAVAWEKPVQITDHFILHKIMGDLKDVQLEDFSFDLVYFDAFGPDVQPELWTEGIFQMLYRAMKTNASLVTYSVKGLVTRALKSAGFSIEKLPGPPGKREITRATKRL
ncbi:MAG: tRNA (5-methylaminomethyl-2-thiouridine)(34)-methyltransferase MnmD [Bacteroidetes bacterium]|nr:tRNA (5-methylaminomethyl-2-thiouridine)(34)-methyltransferase MnmD [Bacteroidota bacterium]